MTIAVRLENGRIINRKVKHVSFGNFVMNIIRWRNDEYLVGEGDEYIRGNVRNTIYSLGRKLTD